MPAGNLREAQVIYKELLKEIEKLGYREKLHLAQRLLQMAIKEEEEQKPESAGPVDPGMVAMVFSWPPMVFGPDMSPPPTSRRITPAVST